jgi:hypothetical protein
MSIDLGRKSGCSGCPEPVSEDKDHVYYPSVYIDGGKELADIPDEGTMLVRYKKTRTTTEEPAEGKKRTSVSLDLLEILETTEENSQKVDDREKALDKLAADEKPDAEESDEPEEE